MNAPIHCHDKHLLYLGYQPHWQEPSLNDTGPYDYDFHRCSYCGSMSPVDLLAALNKGAILQMADWKYGWPHKFYLFVPNPAAGQMRIIGGCWLSIGTEPNEQQKKTFANWHQDQDGRWCGERVAPAEVSVQAKFYSEHLAEADPLVFAGIAHYVEEQTGIQFARAGDGLAWKQLGR